MAVGLAGSLFFDVTPAHAEEALPVTASGTRSVELAKKVIKEVAPIVSDKHAPDVTQAALTLEAEDFIQKPLVVETEITPEYKPSARFVSARVASLSGVKTKGNVPHAFPYGYCTYYVAQKRSITWSGNAGTWLVGAVRSGLATGKTPKVGAIMVTNESRVGHVAYVEAVDGDAITISEMNYLGFGRISTRVLSASSRVIKGFIY